MSVDISKLNQYNKTQLMDIVKNLSAENGTLSAENIALKEMNTFMEQTNRRLEKLEREQNLHAQYSRRDSIEISGIPSQIRTEELEREVIKIYEAAQVSVHGESLREKDIQACHRIGKKQETTIVKFVNRKFAREGQKWQKLKK